MLKPHALFEIWRPDEVAECLEGVPAALYTHLWECVSKYDNAHLANIEDIGPHDVVGINATRTWWDEFTPEEQGQLNALAEAHDAEVKDLLDSHADRTSGWED